MLGLKGKKGGDLNRDLRSESVLVRLEAANEKWQVRTENRPFDERLDPGVSMSRPYREGYRRRGAMDRSGDELKCNFQKPAPLNLRGKPFFKGKGLQMG